jgi:uncharacterized protein (TIGR00297 family)
MHDLAMIAGWMPRLSRPQLEIAVVVTLIFAGFGRWVRGVSWSGAVAGAAVCFLLYASAGGEAVAALVSVFVLTWMATRFGRVGKQKLGTAEKSNGRRASQVLANLGVATVAAVLYVIYGRAGFLLAMAAALSEAAADTVSSEIGQAVGTNPRLITTWRVVPAGTDGGVTVAGTLAGVMAAVLIALVCVLTGLLPWKWFGIAVGAATVGMMADSFLGAWLERRGMLNNDLVNFLGTLIAAGMAFLVA